MYTKIKPHTLHGLKQQTKGGTLFGVLLGLGLATILAGVAVWFLYTAPTPFIDKQVTAAKTGTAAQQQAQIQSAMQGMQGMAAGTPVPVAPPPLALPGKPGDMPPEKRFQFYDILAGKKDAVPETSSNSANKTPNKPQGMSGMNGMAGMAGNNSTTKPPVKDKDSSDTASKDAAKEAKEKEAAAAKEKAAKEAKEKAAKEAKEKEAAAAKEKAAKEAKEKEAAAAREKEAAAREGNKPPSRFYLQAGSFSKLHDADNQKARLALLGIASSVQPVAIDDRTLYRVRLGPFNRMEEASRVRSELAISGIEANLVKPKE